MLTHSEIWRGIDRLAESRNLSPSGLAKKAGLDPTTFNKSKRVTPAGKPRWPSTESLAKVLEAIGSSLDEFSTLIQQGDTTALQRVPLIGFAQAGDAGYFDDAGFPAGGAWDFIDFPSFDDEHAYALEVSGASMEPLFREGDVLIVSPSATLRRGDRVVAKTREGEVMAKQLARQTATRIELKSLNPEHPDRSFTPAELEWLARILWISQ